MQAPSLPEEDSSNDFQHGGWARPYWDEVMTLVGETAFAEPYDALFGRKTYDLFAAHRPPDDSPLGRATKYVVTSNPDGLGWPRSVALTGDLKTEVSALKQQDGPPLQVHGSWQLAQALLAHDLVDEIRLWTFPVVVGAGKRLFATPAARSAWTVTRTDKTAGGVVMTWYHRADEG